MALVMRNVGLLRHQRIHCRPIRAFTGWDSKGWGNGSPNPETWAIPNICSGTVDLRQQSHSPIHAQMPEEEWRDLAVVDLSSMEVAALRKKLKWMAYKRGWAEIEPILRQFHDEHVAEMTDDDVRSFSRLLQCDDMFLSKMLSGVVPAPPELDTNVFRSLKAASGMQQTLEDVTSRS